MRGRFLEGMQINLPGPIPSKIVSAGPSEVLMNPDQSDQESHPTQFNARSPTILTWRLLAKVLDQAD